MYLSFSVYQILGWVGGKMPQKLSNTGMDIISNISYSEISKDVYRRAHVNNPTVLKEGITVLMGLT